MKVKIKRPIGYAEYLCRQIDAEVLGDFLLSLKIERESPSSGARKISSKIP